MFYIPPSPTAQTLQPKAINPNPSTQTLQIKTLQPKPFNPNPSSIDVMQQ